MYIHIYIHIYISGHAYFLACVRILISLCPYVGYTNKYPFCPPLHLPAATDLKVAIDAISAYTHGTALRNNNNKALNAI